MPIDLSWLNMVPGEYNRAAGLQGIHQAAAGIRGDTAQRERERAALEREEQMRRAQTERERATGFAEDKSLFDADTAAFNAQQANVQAQSKAQVKWLQDNQARLSDPVQRAAALAENAALFPVADQSIQRPQFGDRDVAPSPYVGEQPPGFGADVVEAEAGPEPEAEYDVEAAVMDAIAAQTGIEEGVLEQEQEGFGAAQDVTAPVSSTEQSDLDDFLGSVAGGGLMAPPGMDAMVPTLPANLGVSSDPRQLRSPVQLPDGGPMPPQDISQAAPAGPPMAPPGMGMGAQAFGPPLSEVDAQAAMQEAISMGIMPDAQPVAQGPALTRITMANGEELLIDFETPDQASADAIQQVADAIAEGTPDVGRDAAKAIQVMQASLLKANRGDVEKTQKQMLDTWLKLSDYEKSMRNAQAISRSKGNTENVQFYKLGLTEMNKDHSDTSTFGKTRSIVSDVYKGLQDVQSDNPMRKSAALKSMVTAIESRVSDKDMDFAPGDLSIIQHAKKWFSTNIGGTMSDEMQHRLEGSLKAIYHHGMKKQREDYERVQSRINDTTNMWEKKGLMTAANKAFANYEQTSDRPGGFYSRYRVGGGGGPRGTRSSVSAKGRGIDQLKSAGADDLIGEM